MKVKFDDKQIKWGLMAFFVIAAAIILYFIIARATGLALALTKCISVLTPFVYGLVMAYLLVPIYNLCTRKFYRFFNNRERTNKHSLTIAKALSTIISIVIVIVVVCGFFWMIIPGLIDSLVNIAGILPESMDKFTVWLEGKAHAYSQAQEIIGSLADNFTTNFSDFVQKKILPEYMSIATTISNGLVGILIVIKNFFIGLIICAYFLNSKEVFAAQSKKLIVAVFSEKRADSILRLSEFANRTFGGFINGKLIDSLIVGIICFICMNIFGWHYALLISCIIGVTNIIPFFGPFIGAIPSALLLLIVDPMECVYFLIFILVLQQVDGNILGPKILGESTGLRSFWVMFALLVGGGLFGVIGLVIGIPIFAIIYTYVSKGVNHVLDKKGYSINIKDYKVDKYRIRETSNKKEGNK